MMHGVLTVMRLMSASAIAVFTLGMAVDIPGMVVDTTVGIEVNITAADIPATTAMMAPIVTFLM
jgi:hypothetical protein